MFYLFWCCGRHYCFLALVWSHPVGQALSTVLSSQATSILSSQASVKTRPGKIRATTTWSGLVLSGHKMKPSSCSTVLLMSIKISFQRFVCLFYFMFWVSKCRLHSSRSIAICSVQVNNKMTNCKNCVIVCRKLFCHPKISCRSRLHW